MQQAARNVGGFIATANLAALGALDWDIETWDDSERCRRRMSVGWGTRIGGTRQVGGATKAGAEAQPEALFFFGQPSARPVWRDPRLRPARTEGD